ncbi:MAG: glutamine--tRNA ligase, partial [Veillonellaceae bacterium]|nr:glutamine--tRNA ligase [Veillonellaceae bacterium]
LHWVAADTALDAEVRIYDTLLRTDENGNLPDDFMQALNPDSLEVLPHVKVEPSLLHSAAGTAYQFLREGYFVTDPDTTPDHLVFNKIVGLRDSWAKAKKKG